MSVQTSLDSFFKSKSNVSKESKVMNAKNKLKRRSLSLTKVPRPYKSPKKPGAKTEDEVICLSSSGDEFLTPPERKGPNISLSNMCGEASKAIKSQQVELNTLSIHKKEESPYSSTDSLSTIIYNVLSPRSSLGSPRTPTKTPRTPKSGDKFFSPSKKRVVNKKSPAKRNLSLQFKENEILQSSPGDTSSKKIYAKFQDDKTLFLYSKVEEYLKSDTLRHLIDEDSQLLLSNYLQESEPGLRLICRLYWRLPGWYRSEELEKIASEKSKMSSPQVYEMMKSLLDNKLITAAQSDGANSMGFDDYVKMLKRPELQQICKELKLKMQSKQEAADALRKFSQGKAISNYFTGTISNNSIRVMKILKSKTGQCYKLSDKLRDTLYTLHVLMYLGMDYSIIRDKKLELILLHDKINRETYPVDKNMAVDDASVVFHTRDEFNRYLEAHTLYENYIASIETREKCAIVLNAYNMYIGVTDDEMLRYKSLPPWLRRFTPANIFVKIMESGVQELKKDKSREEYEIAVNVLDELISQTAFRQHKKAEWYAEKALILHKHLDRSEQAANTLLEGFQSSLSEVAKDALRPRAKLIAKQRNVTLDDGLREALRILAEQEHVLECQLPAEHLNKQPMDNYNQRGKLKFEAHTEEGRTIVSAEQYCVLHYTHNGGYTHGEHWEGRIVTTIFFLLFWDIIYTKPLGVTGIFMNHFQRYPLDMFSHNFYINRKTLIDDRLTLIEETSDDGIIEMMKARWDERPESEVSDIQRSMGWAAVEGVCRCLGAEAISAICRRLAEDYGYAHSGFPDLTVWNVHTKQIKFVEVKTDADKPSVKQLQWLQYLISHGIDAGFCYVGANTTRCKARRDVANDV